MRKYHCFFEQSGTFKNEFKKLGYEAYDYDILNDFNETDYQIDLFKEIENAYDNKESIFDAFTSDNDFILAFFPCVRFEQQIIMHFKGVASQLKNVSDIDKLKYDLKLHDELHRLYSLVTKLAIVCKKRVIPLIIENPYRTDHYLTRYWCLEPSLIDYDRTLNGDYYEKPTQYFFINCESKRNIIFEPVEYVKKKKINHLGWANKDVKIERSMIHPQYANRFIREFITGDDDK